MEILSDYEANVNIFGWLVKLDAEKTHLLKGNHSFHYTITI